MATYTQRYLTFAQRKKDNARTRILKKNPQARGWVNRVTIVTPRKPNSAKRPVVKVFMKKINRLTAHIPGIGHTLKKFGKILIRGRGPRDLPGVRYSGVRGVLDFIGLRKKKRRRSIYGAEQNDMSKIRARRKYRLAIRKAENERIRKEHEELIFASEQPVVENLKIYNKNFKYVTALNKINKKNFFFFKNPVFFIKYRITKNYKNYLIRAYFNFLIVTSFLNVYSCDLICMFLKNYLYLRKIEFSNVNLNFYVKNKKKQIITHDNLTITKITGYNPRRYSLIMWFSQFKFFYLPKNFYMLKTTKKFLMPKRHVRLIEEKKKMLLFFKNSNITKKKKIICKITNKKFYTYNNKIAAFNFPFMRNNFFFFKRLLRVLRDVDLCASKNKVTKGKTKLRLLSNDFIFVKRTAASIKILNSAYELKNKKLRYL